MTHIRTIDETATKEGLNELIDDVTSGREAVFITGVNGNKAVLISEDYWRSIQETIYLNSVPGLAESTIDAGKEPIEECIREKDVDI